MLATGSSYNACLAAKPALESYGELTVDIQEPFHFAHYGKLSPSIDTVITQCHKVGKVLLLLKQ